MGVPKPEGKAQSPATAPDERAPIGEDFLFHLYRGSELLEDNRLREARDELLKAYDLDNDDTKCAGLLASACFRLGFYTEALSIYEQLRIHLKEDDSLALNLALCYFKTGQLTLARTELEALTVKLPDHRRAWGYLGLVYERLALFDRAEFSFHKSGHEQLASRMAVRQREGSDKTGANGKRRSVPSGPVDDAETSGTERFSFAVTSSIASHVAQEMQQQDRDRERDKPRNTAMPGPFTPQDPAHHVPVLGHGAPSAPRRPTLMARSPDEGGKVTQVPPPPRVVADAMMFQESMPSRALWERFLGDIEPFAAQFPEEPGVHVMSGGRASFVNVDEQGFIAKQSSTKIVLGEAAAGPVNDGARGSHHPLGGISQPFLKFGAPSKLVLWPQKGARLFRFLVGSNPAHFRLGSVVGFAGSMVHETSTFDREALEIVQFSGRGTVVVEVEGDIMAVEVKPSFPVSIRRELVFGWVGRFAPKIVSPEEAFGAQRGLYAFAGEGTLLVLAGTGT